MLLQTCLGVLFLSGVAFAKGTEILEGCSEVPNRNESRYDRFNVTDFEFNNAKELEIFRLRMVFKGFSPGIGVEDDGTDYMFGPFNNSFAMYKLVGDSSVLIEPFLLRGNNRAFNIGKYTPIDVVLTKEGLFSVFVYDEFGFAMSHLIGHRFSSARDLKVLFGAQTAGTDEQFFYDCPFTK
ncbi:hypothetical protein ACFFRR_010275 [Megaselia abdita]